LSESGGEVKYIHPWIIVTSNKYSPLGRNIHSRAKISTPEQLAGQAQLHSASLDTEAWSAALADAAQSSKGEQCSPEQTGVQQSTQASKWSG
jgi:hypothetical protein